MNVGDRDMCECCECCMESLVIVAPLSCAEVGGTYVCMYVRLLSFTAPVLLPCPTQLHVVSQSLPVLPFQIEDAMRPDTDTVSGRDMVGWWYTAVQHLRTVEPTVVHPSGSLPPHTVLCTLHACDTEHVPGIASQSCVKYRAE